MVAIVDRARWLVMVPLASLSGTPARLQSAGMSESLRNWRPIFEPLKDLSYFRQFKVNHDIDTVVWPNHADFAPEFLYEIGEMVSEPLPPADAARRG